VTKVTNVTARPLWMAQGQLPSAAHDPQTDN